MSKVISEFKKEYSFEERKLEGARIREKYPDRIPVIVEKSVRAKDLPDIDKKKFLVPNDITVGQMCYVVRKRIKLEPEKALFLVCGNKMPPTSQMMSALYKEEKEPDHFLFLTFESEQCFGNVC